MSEPGTWIKLDRNILKWEWYTDSNTKAVFIHLLLKANTKSGVFRGISVKRGQLATSRQAIANEIGLTERAVRTGLEHLKDTGEIKIQPNNKFSVITIVNYDRYQDNTGAVKPQKEKPEKKKEVKKKKPQEPPKEEEKYIPLWWELNIPQDLWGRFDTEDEYWEYAAQGGED